MKQSTRPPSTSAVVTDQVDLIPDIVSLETCGVPEVCLACELR